jgi:hypothetical protein
MAHLTDPAHPVWKIIRLIIVGIFLLLLLQFNYNSGLEGKDLVTIFITLCGLAGFDALKKQITNHRVES